MTDVPHFVYEPGFGSEPITQRHPDDVLTARDLHEQYGLAPRVAESIVRSLLRQGKGVPSPIRRRLVLRKDVFPARESTHD